MTKDVLIKISGLQWIDGEQSDPIEVIAPGSYYLKNDRHYVIYDEIVDDSGGIVHNTLRMSPDTVDIRKTGAVSTHMVFRPGDARQTHYETPLGEMVIGTKTKLISLQEEEDSLHVEVTYSLDINYNPVSDCGITIDVSSREKTKLNLSGDPEFS